MDKARESKRMRERREKYTAEELSRREEIIRALRERREAGRNDIKGNFDLASKFFYYNFLLRLEDRRLVEEDLKELRSMFNALGDRMVAIIEKSKKKTPQASKGS